MQNTLPQFPFDRYKNQPWCLVSRSLPRFRYIVLLHHPTNSTNCSQLLSPCPLNIRNCTFYLPYGQIPFVIRQMSVSDPLLADSNDKWALFRWDQAFGSVQSLHKVKSGRGGKKGYYCEEDCVPTRWFYWKMWTPKYNQQTTWIQHVGFLFFSQKAVLLRVLPAVTLLGVLFYSLNIPFFYEGYNQFFVETLIVVDGVHAYCIILVIYPTLNDINGFDKIR